METAAKADTRLVSMCFPRYFMREDAQIRWWLAVDAGMKTPHRPRFLAEIFRDFRTASSQNWSESRSFTNDPTSLVNHPKAWKKRRKAVSWVNMGVQKRTRKFATVKRIIGQRDARLKKNLLKTDEQTKTKKEGKDGELIREVYVYIPPETHPS